VCSAGDHISVSATTIAMAAEESTPLLGSSSSPNQGQDETSPLMGASAPPPADAPPPPPGDDEEVPLNNVGDKNGKSSSSSWWNNSSTSIDTNTIIDDTSQSQLSLSQSKKQRRGKKKRSGDASTIGKRSSSTNNKTKKRKKTTSDDDGRPQKTIFHLSFDAVRYLAIFASCAMLFMQIIPIVILGVGGITGLQYFVRIYLIIFCVSFILLESRIPLLRRLTFPSHDNNWILRGFMYTFIGIIGMEQDVAIKVEDIASGTSNILLGPNYATLFASLSIAIATWIMVGVGVLYMLLGVMCLQKLYERLEKEYHDKLTEWKQKKKREKEFQKEKEEYVKYEKERREGRAEWYDDIETGA
jgi:hypothetical protein